MTHKIMQWKGISDSALMHFYFTKITLRPNTFFFFIIIFLYIWGQFVIQIKYFINILFNVKHTFRAQAQTSLSQSKSIAKPHLWESASRF